MRIKWMILLAGLIVGLTAACGGYTPKHGSWLNMAEIEFSVLARGRVLRRRIADEETLSGEIAALEAERNQAGATIDWRFSTVDARVKLHHLYPANN